MLVRTIYLSSPKDSDVSTRQILLGLLRPYCPESSTSKINLFSWLASGTGEPLPHHQQWHRSFQAFRGRSLLQTTRQLRYTPYIVCSSQNPSRIPLQQMARDRHRRRTRPIRCINVLVALTCSGTDHRLVLKLYHQADLRVSILSSAKLNDMHGP